MTRPRLALLACLLAVALVATVARMRTGQLDAMLGTDEADYVRAMQYGAAANYLGTRERSGFAFTAQVIDEYRRTGWARPFQRDWSANDAAGLRHYHPPLAMYPIGLLASSGATEERTLRVVPLMTGVLACAAAVMLAWLLLAGASGAVRSLMATAAGMLVALSPYHVSGSLSIGPHAAFSLLSTLTLAALVRAAHTRDRPWWLTACAAFGLATLTVPYWALLVPAVLWTWWWGMGSSARTGRVFAAGALTVAVTAALAWPPLVYGAAFVKPALMYAGIVINPLVEGRTAGLWMLSLAQSHPALVTLGAIGLMASPAVMRERLRPFITPAVFIAGFVLLNLRVGHMKALYASDVLAPLAAVASGLAGLGIIRLTGFAAPAVAAGSLAAVIGLGWPSLDPHADGREWREPLRTLDQQLAGSTVLVTPRPAGAIMKYYVPQAQTVLDSSDSTDVVSLGRAVESGAIDVVLQWGGSTEPGGVARRAIGERPPDGRSSVGGTIVSWWRLE